MEFNGGIEEITKTYQLYFKVFARDLVLRQCLKQIFKNMWPLLNSR